MINISPFIHKPTIKSIPISPLPQKIVAPSTGWSIDHLQLKMRKQVRKQMRIDQMNEQLAPFFSIHKQIVINKAIVVGVLSLALSFVINLEATTMFAFFMLVSTQLICNTIMSFSDTNLINNIRRIQPIVYCSIYYSLLKWALGINSRQINLSIIVISIIATLTKYTIQLYHSFLLNQLRNTISQIIQQKTIYDLIRSFFTYESNKFGLILRMSKHLVIFLGMFSTALIAFLVYFNKFTMQVLQLNYILFTIVLFVSIEVYLDLVDYLNVVMGQSNKFLKIIRNQMPIFINLLRLQQKPNNKLIQHDCLKYIFLKNLQVQNFLTSQTCKSLIYSTYMDIFNQYAFNELEASSKIVNELSRTIKANDKIVSQRKNLLQDLFVYFKKITAFISSEWSAIQLMETYSSLSFTYIILRQINQSKQSKQLLSKKVNNLSKTIICKINECSTSTSILPFTRLQLERVSQDAQ